MVDVSDLVGIKKAVYMPRVSLQKDRVLEFVESEKYGRKR